MTGPTLHDVLASLGYTHRRAPGTPGAVGAHEILDGTGEVVLVATAGETWRWLHETGLHPNVVGGGTPRRAA